MPEENTHETIIEPIVFLMGSGVSIPGGYPSTSDITSMVLSGTSQIIPNGVYIRHSANIYKPHEEGYDPIVRLLCIFLRYLKSEIDSYYIRYPYKSSHYKSVF